MNFGMKIDIVLPFITMASNPHSIWRRLAPDSGPNAVRSRITRAGRRAAGILLVLQLDGYQKIGCFQVLAVGRCRLGGNKFLS